MQSRDGGSRDRKRLHTAAPRSVDEGKKSERRARSSKSKKQKLVPKPCKIVFTDKVPQPVRIQCSRTRRASQPEELSTIGEADDRPADRTDRTLPASSYSPNKYQLYYRNRRFAQQLRDRRMALLREYSQGLHVSGANQIRK